MAPNSKPASGRGSSVYTSREGYTLIELMMIGTILALLALFLTPRIVFWSGVVHVRLAAGEVAGMLGEARTYAIRHRANIALRFENVEDGPRVAMYQDGDGDGVLSADIRREIDTQTRVPHIIAMTAGNVRFGFPAGRAPIDPSHPGRRLTRLDDPIRFNRSNMASFSELGTATPGTVYLTADDRHLAAVRVRGGSSSHVTILLYDADDEVWRRAW